MKDDGINRREFLKGAVAGGAVATTAAVGLAPQTAEAQQKPAAPPASQGYSYLNLEEAAFVEAIVDHMIPADQYSPKGTDLGINIFIDRALAGGWGKGDRLYMQGPWKVGHPNQGYQLPLKPADLYRAGIAATNAYCKKTYSKSFDQLPAEQKQEVLVGLQGNKIKFEGGLPAGTFFGTMYQTVMEGMFADPIYGGNRNKAGWKMIGFPGVVAVHAQNIEKFRDKRYVVEPVSIADMS
jgi:gluconate 2-dehydrogenase gamma chain